MWLQGVVDGGGLPSMGARDATVSAAKQMWFTSSVPRMLGRASEKQQADDAAFVVAVAPGRE